MTWCVPCGYDTKNLPNGNCSSCGNENNYSTSLKEAVEKYRALGLSVIPNRPQTKAPDLVEYKPYYQKICDVDPKPDGNVGIMTGVPSGGLIGFDDDSYAETFLTLMPEYRESTLCTKSGKKGGAILFRMDNPPEHFDLEKEIEVDGVKVKRDIQFFSKDMQIIMPPSIHPDTKKQYQILHDNPIKKITQKEFDNIIKVLNDNGWLRSNEKIIQGVKVEGAKVDRELATLHEGNNRQGAIFQKLGKYFVKVAKEEITEQDCINKAFVLNAECGTPYDDTKKVEDIGKKFYKMRLSDEEVDTKSMAWYLTVKSLILDKKMVVPSSIYKEVLKSSKIAKEDHKMLKDYIDKKFEDNDVFPTIKENCFEHGVNKTPILFDKNQINETAEYLKGLNYIKRIELNGKLIVFDKFYTDDSNALLFRNATKFLIKSSISSRKEIVGYAESSSPIINQDDIENDNHKKCLLNGTFDWKIGLFKQDYFSPDNIILNQIPRNFDESKSWDNIEKHVKEIIPDDKDRQSFYDFLSLVLMPYNGIPMILFLVGVSGSGKSQLGLLTQMLFGKNNFSSSTLQDITTDSTTRGNIAYNLVNCDFDMKHNTAPEISVLKKIGTQDEMSGRGIYEQTAKYRPSFRFMGLANSLFQLVDVDDAEAVYERSYIIKLNRKFRDTEDEVRNVFQTIVDLDDELDGFMTYLLNNAKEIHDNQEIHFPQSTTKTEELWNQVGNQVGKFSDIWIEHSGDNKGERTTFYQKWLDYQQENNLKPIGRNKFYETFEDLNSVAPTMIRVTKEIEYRGYQGIRLRTQDEVDKITNHKETAKEKLLRLLKKITNPEDLRIGQAINIFEKQ